MSETFQVRVPIEGPLSKEQYFAPRAVRGLSPCKRLGLGTAGLGGCWGPVDDDESVRVLHDAWNAGHLLADSAPAYGVDGQSEKILGLALQSWKGEAPVVCTKIEGYPAFAPPAYAKDWRASMFKQLVTSQERFGRYVDALALHDPEAAPPEFAEACDEFLQALVSKGMIRATGLGGGGGIFQPEFLNTGRYDYIITFKRLTALSLQSMMDSVPAARANNASVFIGSGTFMGLLGSKYDEFTANPPAHIAPVFLERAKALKILADAAGVPLSQLAIRFLLSTPSADFVLAGAAKPAEWADTLKAYEAGPLPEDLYRKVWADAQLGVECKTGG